MRPSAFTAQAPSTVRPSKGSKNSGLKVELDFSRTYHAEGIPLLVSPLLLRSRQLGQIDLARLKKDKRGWVIEIGEVKSSTVGEMGLEFGQKRRIIAGQNFLASLFGHRTRFTTMNGKDREISLFV